MLAREAVASMADSDNITGHAEILVDLAEVLRADGDLPGAATALIEAVGLHEEKGNALPAERCRELLASIAAGGRRQRPDDRSRAAEGQQTPKSSLRNRA